MVVRGRRLPRFGEHMIIDVDHPANHAFEVAFRDRLIDAVGSYGRPGYGAYGAASRRELRVPVQWRLHPQARWRVLGTRLNHQRWASMTATGYRARNGSDETIVNPSTTATATSSRSNGSR
jgi:hypothetical protein